jgi:hypothetical protein
MAALDKPRPGDPLRLSAQFMSEAIDSIDYTRMLRESGGALTGRGRGSNGICYVKNGSGVDLVTGGVLGLSDVPYLYADNPQGFLNEQTFNGVAPVYQTHRTQFAVALEPAAANVLTRCVVSGIVAVQVKFDPAAWWYNSAMVGDIGTGMTKGLVACPVGGARILYPCWPISGSAPASPWDLTAPVWSIVDVGSSGGPGEWQGKLDAVLNSGSTATFSLWTKASGSWADTTKNVTINAPPRLESGSIAASRFGRIRWEETEPGWEYDSGPCP